MEIAAVVTMATSGVRLGATETSPVVVGYESAPAAVV